MGPWNALTAAEAIAHMSQGALRSEELAAACLHRISLREPSIRAWSHVAGAAALSAARDRDNVPQLGPLHGVPVGIKDIIDTARMPSERGEPEIFAGRTVNKDASAVGSLETAGAVLVGKTASSRHTIMIPGPTTNPRAPGRTPGGSSSGSAAAVADHMVPITLATQTAGSIIRPATYCGIIGYKPTFGLIDRDGVRAYSEELDTIGAMARSIDDIQLVMSALAPDHGFDEVPAEAAPPQIIVVRTTDYGEFLDSEMEVCLTTTSNRLRSFGFEVAETDPPFSFRDTTAAQHSIMLYDFAHVFADHVDHHRDRLHPDLISFVEAGRLVSRHQYEDCLQRARDWRIQLRNWLTMPHVVLTYATATTAPPMTTTGTSEYIRPWTLMHTPTLALPLGLASSGAPIGLQLIGPHGSDAWFLSAAQKLIDALN